MPSSFHPRTVVLIVTDVVIIYGGILLALYVRMGFDETVFQLVENDGSLKIAFVTLVCLINIYFFDLYDYKVVNNRRELNMRLVQAMGITWAVLSVIFYLFPFMMVGRGIAVYSVIITLLLLLSLRGSIHFFLGHPEIGERILIVGDGPVVKDTVEVAVKRRDAGLRIVGFVTDNGHHVIDTIPGIGWLGNIGDLESIVNEEKIDRIVIGVRDRRGSFPAETLLRLRLAGNVNIEESTSFFERVTGRVHLDNLRPSWLIFSMRPRDTRLRTVARDVTYRFIALIGLIVSFPIGVLAAVLIKIESGGTCFYKQKRVGKNGRVFEVIKFRSMKSDAESNGEPVWANSDDDRATIVGKIIRKIRVDEIPQFWNILKGEMSFIGPRPERPYFVSKLAKDIPYYEYRHLVAPGLTGWAQINFPYGASVEDARQKLQYDLFYIKNQNLILDILIMFETVKTVLFGRGGR